MTADAPAGGPKPATTPSPGAGATTAAPPPDPATEVAARRIRERFPDAILEESLGGRHPWLRIAPERFVEVCRMLRDDPETRLDCCHLVSGVDWPATAPGQGPGHLEAVYHLVSYARRPDPAYRRRAEKNDGFVVLRVRVPRDRPDVPSVASIWPGADWHERETYDLLGIRFTGRASLRRILLPEDWPGHPLRKDWEFPADYHGVPIVPPEGR
jgi:NADH-quinone oxidoreductase subunit C